MTAGAREASLRPFGKPSPRWWLLVGALSTVVLIGITAWVVQLRNGMGVAGYNDHAFWAIYIADVITFIGVSYGGAVVSAILRLTGATWRAPLTRLAEGTAVCTVLVGGALIIPHIGRPDRLYELVTHPNFSAPVFWDFIAVTTYTVASVVFFALPLVPDMAILGTEHAQQLGRGRRTLYAVVSRGWVGAPRQRRVLSGALGLVSIMIIPLAVSVHSVLAWAFATTSRPWWHESIWAPQFVVAALYSGVALVILVVAGFRRGYHLEAFISERHFVRLGFILAAFSTTYLYLTFADILPGAYVGEAGTAAVFGELLVGHLAPWFWLFAIGGGVLPLLLVALPWTRNVRGMVVASTLVVPMMWLKRMLMVIAPANFDVMTGASGSYHFTWVPIAVTLAAMAAIPLMLMLLFRVVPLLSIDEIEEIDEAEEMNNAAAAEAFLRAQPSKPEAHDVSLVGAPGTAPRVAGVAGVLLLVAFLGMFGVGAAAPVQAAATPGATKIALTGAQAARAGAPVALTAKLTDPAGHPLAKAEVKFFLATTVFGPRPVPLGSATTDASGVARLSLGGHSKGYRPTTTGPQEFVASYAPSGQEPIESSTNINVTGARSAYTPAPPKPLDAAGNILVKALFLIVATIWLLLIAQVIRVRRVCRPARMPTISSA
jgi:Ni/Fe-hydrogenase subunit HybB-like protein